MAAALEQYVTTVQTLSSQGNFTALVEFISKNMEMLGKNAPHLDNVLATLDYQQHSIGVMGILVMKLNQQSIPDFETLFVQIQEFITSCNGEQARYALESFAELCHKFTLQIVERKQPARGLSILVRAIQKIQLHPAQLTSIHSDLCQLCLLSKNLKPALQFLDVDITDISREGGHYDAKDFLLYFYYGGMIYTALKIYTRALYFFEMAVTTPSMAVSHIMMEAYKKFILVALIVQGKIPSLPKYAPQIVARYIKPLCQAYHDLANAYATNNPAEVRAAVTKHSETFTRDNNMGLVKQCVTSMFKKNIQRLTKTFLTLSLADMANRVQLSGPVEAEKYVLHMINDGEIFATINQKDGMVRFHDNPEKYNSSSMLLDLDREMQKCIKMDEKLREMDREIAVNPQYVQKVSGIHDEDMPASSSSKGQSF
ncbi:COP9 signalosome complex subunit 3-like [Pomacea canaliculata]|uniref:COP9 signalosome complex subunit 3-like n=1 Tax=Pomacea canaliculata TaxID=400727 RepID=UPI000D72B12E|nr:COP9 signalosome complex subunit 3-like [Pomacea canaliculata]